MPYIHHFKHNNITNIQYITPPLHRTRGPNITITRGLFGTLISTVHFNEIFRERTHTHQRLCIKFHQRVDAPKNSKRRINSFFQFGKLYWQRRRAQYLLLIPRICLYKFLHELDSICSQKFFFSLRNNTKIHLQIKQSVLKCSFKCVIQI